jgi:arabinose-5-phosphate isomerase
MNLRKIAKEVLEIEANALLSTKIDNGFLEAIQIIEKTKGKLIITGVGKSGLIGAKIAATFASTGTSSFFLHPTEALHGDLGMISKGDSVLAISYSGESEELAKILPHIKRFEIPLIGMSRDKNSTLGKYSDAFIPTIIEKEACPLGIAPTTSTTLTLALGDALAVCMMKKRGFTKNDFASFHPGGSLGKQLFVKVKDLMNKTFPTANKEISLKDAIVKMTEGKIGHLLFLKKGEVIALLSDGDLRRAMMKKDFNLNDKAIKFATKQPKTVDSEMLASDVLNFMENKKIQLLPVVKNNKVIGVIHIHNLIEAGIK